MTIEERADAILRAAGSSLSNYTLTREAILAAVREAMGVWQPIETAPRDGTEVLVLIRSKVIRLGWYFAPSSRTFGWRDENGKPIKPVAWMPLPPAPGGKA